ncbi:MAG: Gfo/Idh/MocA family oxidoreductase [Proteobacteria bacterium]|nr:Gfo/Idh/MocA family oxidoreductase [Pseudomonadota bacterium]
MDSYRAAIIGCGMIGAFFDVPASDSVLTHAKAYTTHPRTHLCAVMDIDEEKAASAGDIWDCAYYSEIDDLFHHEKPDIVSVCTPTENHYNCLRDLVRFRPRAVIAEKPLTDKTNLSQEIVRLYASEGIPLFVNYTRRYDPVLQRVRADILSKKFGTVLYAMIIYTKGILHNGSHAVDLCHFLFGELHESHPVWGRYVYSSEDPTISAFLSFERCANVFFIAADERYYSIFDFEIAGENRKIRFENSGLEYREDVVRDDPMFSGYRDLKRTRYRRTGLHKAMLGLVDNVVRYLEGDDQILCSGADAYLTQIVCENLIKTYRGAHA